ncbi:hypothetical protein A8V49_04040 [Yersinia pestis]|nr:hypothetical protein A8V49_04040 [Yersinia pestis]
MQKIRGKIPTMTAAATRSVDNAIKTIPVLLLNSLIAIHLCRLAVYAIWNRLILNIGAKTLGQKYNFSTGSLVILTCCRIRQKCGMYRNQKHVESQSVDSVY